MARCSLSSNYFDHLLLLLLLLLLRLAYLLIYRRLFSLTDKIDGVLCDLMTVLMTVTVKKSDDAGEFVNFDL